MKLVDILVEELPKRGGWPEGAECVVQDSDDTEFYFFTGGPVVNSGKSWWFVGDGKREDDSHWIFYDGKFEVAEDHTTSIITRAQYEAALAAKNDGWIEWGGEPVLLADVVEARTKSGDVISGLHNLRHHNMELVAYRLRKPVEVKPEWNGEGLPPVGCEVEFYNNDRFDCRSSVPNDGTKVKIVSHDESHDGIPVAVFTWHSSDRGVGAEVCRAELFRPLRTEADKKRYAAIESLFSVLYSGVSTSQDAIDVYDAIAAGKIPGVKLED